MTQSERTKRYRQRKRERGLCWHCTKPAAHGGLCEDHAAARKQVYVKKVVAGACAHCTKRAAVYGCLCLSCLEAKLEARAVAASTALPANLRRVHRCKKCGRKGHMTRHCDIISPELITTLEWLATR